MTKRTPLDTAYAAMAAQPDDAAARLQFYERLADGEMVMLLETEATRGQITPKVFDLEGGPMVLIFDTEERLGAFTGIPAPYAALPGRVIAAQLAGQGVGLGINLGVATASILLPPEAVDWLAQTLDNAPQQTQATPTAFHAPVGLPESLITGLDAKLARAGALASHALLAAVTYSDGRRGHMLAFMDAVPGAENPLAQATAEALTFSGIDAGEIDVAFMTTADPAAQHMMRVALRFDLPVPETQTPSAPQAPGTDPTRPPILR
ncbi:MAG: SseB family protein [Paracoccaceae bacterium]